MFGFGLGIGLEFVIEKNWIGSIYIFVVLVVVVVGYCFEKSLKMVKNVKKGSFQVVSNDESGRLTNLSSISTTSSTLSKKDLRKLKRVERTPPVTRNGGARKGDGVRAGKGDVDPTQAQINSLVSDGSGGSNMELNVSNKLGKNTVTLNSLTPVDKNGLSGPASVSGNTTQTTVVQNASPPTNNNSSNGSSLTSVPTDSNSSNGSNVKEIQLEHNNLNLRLEVEELKRKLELVMEQNNKRKKIMKVLISKRFTELLN